MSDAAYESSAIRIAGMRFWGKHGNDPGEREREQPIDVEIELVCDVRDALRSDSLADTIDYSAVYKTCERIVTGASFALLEVLADHIGQAILEDRRLTSITVRVRKPRLLDGATPEVELCLRRARP